MSIAFLRPSKMWARAFAFSRSKIVRRIMTVFLWLMKCLRISFKPKIRGSWFKMESMIIPKVVCIAVCLNRLLRTISLIASRLSSITTRIPSRSDSSRIVETPSMSLSFTRLAIFSIRRALFTWYGSSSITIISFFALCSICVLARTLMRPLPDS